MPKFLEVSSSMTLEELTQLVGSQNVDNVLALNNLPRTYNVGQAVEAQLVSSLESQHIVPNQYRYTLLNSMASDSDAFEFAATLTDAGWRQLATYGNLPHYIRIPDTVDIADSVRVIGNGEAVSSAVYSDVMQQIKTTGTVEPNVFNTYSTTTNAGITSDSMWGTGFNRPAAFQLFKLPWGEVSLYSSLSDSSIDFPVYPEPISDKRKANYNTMPDMLYQYEPWQLYQSSGPRENTYVFKFHRDMWTGDHRDGKANELIRFCEANCYADYNGSLVNTSTVSLLIRGRKVITGVVVDVSTEWDGPRGLDGWELFCTLSITIIEVSPVPLNYNKIKSMPLIGE